MPESLIETRRRLALAQLLLRLAPPTVPAPLLLDADLGITHVLELLAAERKLSIDEDQ